MGGSLGALDALHEILPRISQNFSAALIIVLHREKEESGGLMPLLIRNCAVPIGFPEDKDSILAGHIYVAPPNYHLLIEEDHFAYSMDEPEDYARPSIDALFESAAERYKNRVTGIVLTGMRQDGARGLAAIKGHNGEAIVQSPLEAIGDGMPLAALRAVPNAKVLTLREIAEFVASF
ncbi:MAG: chemotaxis protein CheB [Actinomycetota bacterium]